MDSSVIVAILWRECDAPTWIEILDRTSKVVMSVVSCVEANMVICGRRSDPDPHEVASLFRVLGFEIVPVMPKQGETAVAAFLRYGKGGHRARLNLADCFSYALAKVQRAPLLYKGMTSR